MSELLEHLGYGWFKWDTFEVSSDYNEIHFLTWHDRKRVLIINKGKPPKFVKHSRVPAFPKQGDYFCSGGAHRDLEQGGRIVSQGPVRIYSESEPNTALAESNLSSFPDKIFAFQDKVYLMKRDFGSVPHNVNCEVYRREAESLVLEQRFRIHCPRIIGATWLFPEDFDNKTKHVLLSLGTHHVYSPCSQYVYEMRSAELVRVLKARLTLTCPYGCFLDRDFFEKILDKTE
ncbi:MAG: hypothetical protein ACYSUC_00705 [Planctomycetota bacterium]|jgi:hypothetical protein